MKNERNKLIFQNVAPSILANACVFLFSVVDGIFVGQGAGMEALGAVNIALPFVLIVQALNAMASIGGVTITAIRFGRGDKEGAQQAFMHSVTINLLVGILVVLIGCGITGPVCRLLGATGNYYELATDYVFWWALFAVANSVSLNLQSFCRNDGAPGLVAVTNVVSTTMNIFLDWLFVFPLQMGVAGAAIATGISQVAGLLVILTHFIGKKGDLRIRRYKPQKKLFQKILLRGLPEAVAQFSTPVTTFQDTDLKHYYRAGQLISIVGSTICVAVYVLFPKALCGLFGGNAETIAFTTIHMWEYCWGFIVGSVNTLLSAYFYSTKRSAQAIVLNIIRSLVMNSLVILLLPKLFGTAIVWHTFGIYEVLVLIIGIILKKQSERRGVQYR